MHALQRHPLTSAGQQAGGPARRRLLRRCLAGAIGVAGVAAGPMLGLAGCSGAPDPADAVSLDAARAALESGRAVLIDVREPEEHATGVAVGARLLPMRQLGQRWAEIPTDPAQPVLLICHTQNRSSSTLQALRKQGGYGHVRYVQGGMSEWARRGWPMVAPTPTPTLAR